MRAPNDHAAALAVMASAFVAVVFEGASPEARRNLAYPRGRVKHRFDCERQGGDREYARGMTSPRPVTGGQTHARTVEGEDLPMMIVRQQLSPVRKGGE